MQVDDSLVAWLRLTLISGIGGETQRKLLAAFGLPEAIFDASFSSLRQVVGDKSAQLICDAKLDDRVKTACEWVRHDNHHIVTLADLTYPQSLLEIPDPPTVLYVRGRLELLNAPALAIVGSRSPTPQGEQNARNFAASFADAGLTIVSGLALGIDAKAHQGALERGGGTVAFIGTGIDRVYPARNKSLAVEIAEKGAVVSEFALGTPVFPANFPRRNRLISGISRGVLVVEAAVDSGSLITARLANEQGREVFAIPGSIHSPQSRGCHRLIKQGAKLVETASDVMEELKWQAVAPAQAMLLASDESGSEHSSLEPSQSDKILSCMGFEPISIDELSLNSNLATDTLLVDLLHLELEGKISRTAGGLYQRLSSQ